MNDPLERAERLIEAERRLRRVKEKLEAFNSRPKERDRFEVNLGSPFRKGPYISVSKASIRSAIRAELAAAQKEYEEAEKDL